ncbi:MAG: SUMF1/EgtB/PvdO family nonheme iron enzyme, partial [Caldilineaceae bacterium]|nr:SUMF1/EgtB/PvdO family nonheme iron enzyme [Caldilineaceae bacterium]
IDQFEEIITVHPGRWREREGFFRQLNQALLDDPNLWVVLALREDYVAALDPYAELTFNRLRARFYMERMQASNGLEAVRRPAELGGRPFAPGVAEQLVDELRQVRVPGGDDTIPGQYVEPVQLQVVCYQLWERLAEGAEGPDEPPISFEDLAEAGDVNQALEQFYAETLAAVLAEKGVHEAGVSERGLRTWFDKELITETGIRNTVFRNEAAGRTGSMPNVAVDALVSRFLLRTELRGGGAWVELVHDRFVEPIRVSNAAWFPLHLSALQRQAALWDEQGRSAGLLLRDEALAEAEAWAADHADELASHEQDFLTACREAHEAAERERRQSRRIRMLAVVAVAVAVLAIIAAGIAVNATRQANEAKVTAQRQTTRAEEQTQRAEEQTQLAEDRTEIATMLLGVQRDFLAQVDTGGVSVEMLKAQRQRLEQGEAVLASGTAPTVTLPVLAGVPFPEAQKGLDEACQPTPCLRSQVRWELNDELAGGLVLQTDPPAGEKLLWGAAVTLTVSQGKPYVLESPVRMEFVPVPAGEFTMGSDSSIEPIAYGDEKPQQRLDLPEFYIGKYEVTNAQYEACVTAGKCAVPGLWEEGAIPSGKEDHPVVDVSWYDALAFMEWLSAETGQDFRLPTEAEWEKACRGTTGLIYPWRSRDISSDKLNYSDSNMGDTTPVGSYSPDGDSPYGAADMAGNAWEWTSSQHADFPYDATDGRENSTGEALRVLRGGSFFDEASFVRCAVRDRNDPVITFGSYGFRVGWASPSGSGS